MLVSCLQWAQASRSVPHPALGLSIHNGLTGQDRARGPGRQFISARNCTGHRTSGRTCSGNHRRNGSFRCSRSRWSSSTKKRRSKHSTLVSPCGSGLRVVRPGHALPNPTAPKPLERNSYDISRAAAGNPNIRLKVRLRCAESEKPACWAASVRFAPCVCASTARTRRSHKT